MRGGLIDGEPMARQQIPALLAALKRRLGRRNTSGCDQRRTEDPELLKLRELFDVGSALAKTGVREQGCDTLNRAIELLRTAADAARRSGRTQICASVCGALADALTRLGERKDESGPLEEALRAYDEAIAIWSAEHDQRAATARLYRITTLSRLGERQAANDMLLVAERELRELIDAGVFADSEALRAEAFLNLGTVLVRLGERRLDSTYFEPAVEALRLSVRSFDREANPLGWATAQSTLATALTRLGEHGGDAAVLEEAIEAFGTALEVRTRDVAPLHWAATTTDLGAALAALATLKGDLSCLERAVDLYRDALLVATSESSERDFAETQANLGSALFFLGDRRGGAEHLRASIPALEEALKDADLESAPIDWMRIQIVRAAALARVGESERDADLIERARSTLRDVETIAARTGADGMAALARQVGDAGFLKA